MKSYAKLRHLLHIAAESVQKSVQNVRKRTVGVRWASFPFSDLIRLRRLEPAHARQSKCISSALAYSQISVFRLPCSLSGM